MLEAEPGPAEEVYIDPKYRKVCALAKGALAIGAKALTTALGLTLAFATVMVAIITSAHGALEPQESSKHSLVFPLLVCSHHNPY